VSIGVFDNGLPLNTANGENSCTEQYPEIHFIDGLILKSPKIDHGSNLLEFFLFY
jgi:hypothetical protein